MSGAQVGVLGGLTPDARPPFEKLRRISRSSALRLIGPQLADTSGSRKSISKQTSVWAAELKVKEKPQPKEQSSHLKEEPHRSQEEESHRAREGSLHPREESHRAREGSLRPREESHRAREGSLRPREESHRAREGSLRPREESQRTREGSLRPREGSLRSTTGTAYRMSIIKLDAKSKLPTHMEEHKTSAVLEDKPSAAPTGVSKPSTSKMTVDTLSDEEFVTNLMEFSYVNRPTTASSLKSQRWSQERAVYEREHEDNMKQFRDRPYMAHTYPEIPKHYPGTWTVVTPSQLELIIARLSKPTQASKFRELDTKKQQAYVKQFTLANKVKDVQYIRAHTLIKASKQR